MKARNLKHLTFALATCLLAGNAAAQSANPTHNGGWYGTLTAGANIQDDDRGTKNAPFGAIGVGRMINENWAVDLSLNHQNPKFKANEDLNWSQYGLEADARRFFNSQGRVSPYVVAGIGVGRSEEEFIPAPGLAFVESKRTYGTAKAGAGLQFNLPRVAIRTEAAARRSFDDESLSTAEKNFTDVLGSVSLVLPFGAKVIHAPVAAPVIEMPVIATGPDMPACTSLDDDMDAVNNCSDQCPATAAGQVVGNDGCPVVVTLDLRGVNFEFDRDEITPESARILDQAVEILNRHSAMQVSIEGHTDSIGSAAYNQRLSERRAQSVYRYLSDRGIGQSRIVRVSGAGEAYPLAGNDTPEGRALNRRVEISSQK